MSVQPIFRLRNPALLMALAAVFPVWAQAVGTASVDFVAGNVTALSAQGVQRPLVKGAEIGNGDTVQTGDGGRAQVRFSDGALVSLQPQTEFRIDDHHFTGKADADDKGFFSLLKGGLRTITGLVGRAHRDNYKITTNVATIGIRGTEYTAAYDPASNELVVHTGEGLVEVCNSTGCMLLAAGESGLVGGSNTQPRRTLTQVLLPPAQPDGVALPEFTAGDYLMAESLDTSSLSIPTSPMPTTGTGTFTKILSASPVTEVASQVTPGTLTSATVFADFGQLTVSTVLKGADGSGYYNFNVTSTGSIAGNTLSATATSGSGNFCFSSCSASVSGTFLGPAAARVGISYTIVSDPVATGKTFVGSAVLAQ